jgi:hypothetical protein
LADNCWFSEAGAQLIIIYSYLFAITLASLWIEWHHQAIKFLDEFKSSAERKLNWLQKGYFTLILCLLLIPVTWCASLLFFYSDSLFKIIYCSSSQNASEDAVEILSNIEGRSSTSQSQETSTNKNNSVTADADAKALVVRDVNSKTAVSTSQVNRESAKARLIELLKLHLSSSDENLGEVQQLKSSSGKNQATLSSPVVGDLVE